MPYELGLTLSPGICRITSIPWTRHSPLICSFFASSVSTISRPKIANHPRHSREPVHVRLLRSKPDAGNTHRANLAVGKETGDRCFFLSTPFISNQAIDR